MKAAVLCECSGRVRDAFLSRGHEAVSCDLEPSEVPGPHLQGDCRAYDWSSYDLIIGHPPCTYLTSAGARHWARRKGGSESLHTRLDQDRALAFVWWMMKLPVPRIAIENPRGCISTRIRPPDQTIQPWMFGHPVTKATCLWLKGVPMLQPTDVVDGRYPSNYRVSGWRGNKERSRIRSRTYRGIAAAMAEQWGKLPLAASV